MEHRGRGRATRILCVNCNICVNTIRRYLALELDTRVITLLCNWVYPQIITQDDYVCEACRDLAIFVVSNSLQLQSTEHDNQEAGPSHRGHASVCLVCGCSTLHRQSDRILRDNPTELQQSMIDVIQNRVAPRQITVSDRVCHACWLRTQREVNRMNLLDEIRAQAPPEESSSNSENLNQQHEDPPQIPETTPDHTGNTVLPGYRRAANSNNHCVFPNCNNTPLHGISDKLRANILSNYKYYLPNFVRVCQEHLLSNSWESLFESENSIDSFTPEHIIHVFSFVNAFNPTLDFENLQEMDDRAFEYTRPVRYHRLLL